MLTDLICRYTMSNVVDAIQLTVGILEGGRGHTLTTHGVFRVALVLLLSAANPKVLCYYYMLMHMTFIECNDFFFIKAKPTLLISIYDSQFFFQ